MVVFQRFWRAINAAIVNGGVPKVSGELPVDPGILSISGFLGPSRDVPCQGSPWILEYLVSQDSRDHPGMSHVSGACGSWNT